MEPADSHPTAKLGRVDLWIALNSILERKVSLIQEVVVESRKRLPARGRAAARVACVHPSAPPGEGLLRGEQWIQPE